MRLTGLLVVLALVHQHRLRRLAAGAGIRLAILLHFPRIRRCTLARLPLAPIAIGHDAFHTLVCN